MWHAGRGRARCRFPSMVCRGSPPHHGRVAAGGCASTGASLGGEDPGWGRGRRVERREPLPMSMLAWKMGPALAAGSASLVSEARRGDDHSVPEATIFACFIDAGAPDGVTTTVTAADPQPIGDEFPPADPGAKKLSTFTGSTAAGRVLAAGAGANPQRVSVELGGHAPFIVYPDADPPRTPPRARPRRQVQPSGQACTSPNRLYVHQ